MSYLNKISTRSRIVLSLIFLVIIHFSGSITGDEEKVYNFVDSLFKKNISFFEWIKNPLVNCEIWPKCHSAFFKHNFGWFLINASIVKFSYFVFFFYENFIENIFLIEIILSFFNTLCFWLSFIILYINFNKKFTPNITLATIIVFVYGTYLNNFSAGGYVESLLLLLVSIRLCYLSKNNLTNKDIIIIALIDSAMIALRFFYIWLVLIFMLINYIYYSSPRKNIYLNYFIFLIVLLSLFYFTQSLIPTQAYLNTNELREIAFFDYYYLKILRSFCVDDFISIFSLFLKRVYLSFFSISVGLFFIFPIMFLSLFSFRNKIYWLKIFLLLGYICAFSLEQNFYLPAGISGHRGLGPILIIFFPEICNCLLQLSKSKFKSLIALMLSISIIIFSSSIYYRSTLAHYVVFTKNSYNLQLENSNILQIENKVPKCYKSETFGHNFIELHPGIFGWKILLLNLKNIPKTTIKTIVGEKQIYLKEFTPQTLIHRINYLIKYKFHNYENNPLKIFFNDYPIFISLAKFIYYFSLLIIFLLPVYFFNYLFLRKN